MVFLLFFLSLFINSISSQQFYDPNDCSSHVTVPGSRYSCNSFTKSCQTFVVYRSQSGYQTASAISDLFGANQSQVLLLNNLTSPSQNLETGREVLVPINCSCLGQFFQSNVSHIVQGSATYEELACGIFEGLVKSQTLFEENPFQDGDLTDGITLYVPLKCACPDNLTSSNGVKYLLTYSIAEGVGTQKLSKKFNISQGDIWAENSIEPTPTVFPNTTLLVPLKREPFINVNLTDPPKKSFVPTNSFPSEETTKSKGRRNLYIIISVVAVSFLFSSVFAYGFYIKSIRNWKHKELGLQVSCLAPDLLVGVSMLKKFSLVSYSIDELMAATRDFSEDTKISNSGYKGKIDELEVIIERMSSEDARWILDIYSKLNHTNIVRLLGVCHGEGDCSSSYLVFELASKGCLKDCQTNPANVLQWRTRTQIALDVAIGLHYLHFCTIPSFAHMNLNSTNVLITEDWRAKIANFGVASVTDASTEEGLASAKVDIFSFGVILLELISAKEITDVSLLKKSLDFLEGRGSEGGGCFEKLREFVDPRLKEDYPLGEALCLAFLAKACLEDDPLHRPSMNDILKILARMV